MDSNIFNSLFRHYSYSKEDDEIYKDFYDINSEMIPGILKSDESCCTDPDSFASIIRFCDGLCRKIFSKLLKMIK